MAPGKERSKVAAGVNCGLVRCDLYFRGLCQAAFRGGYFRGDPHVPVCGMVYVFQKETIGKREREYEKRASVCGLESSISLTVGILYAGIRCDCSVSDVTLHSFRRRSPLHSGNTSRMIKGNRHP